jgi:glycosyltransferase involved in cell wall biosynthesis
VRNGIDGFLVPPDDVAAWAAAIARFAENRNLVREMRGRITAPRSMEAVVDDMAMVYSAVVTANAVPIGAA